MRCHNKKNETILIVGNKPIASKSLAGERGFGEGSKTIYACSADEALQIASEYPEIDMLLTDLLPDNNYLVSETNGVRFTQEFAQKHPKAKIVFMIP